MDALRSHLGWKLLSLLLAVAIYSSIRFGGLPARVSSDGTPRVSRTLRLPITLMTTAKDPGGFEVSPSEVQVTVRGTESAIDNLAPSDVQVFVNLVNVEEAVQLKARLVPLTPPGIDLVQLQPAEVSVQRRGTAPETNQFPAPFQP